ncbi:hypothetical protein [Oceanobacillus timonensis]|uniref:hypothetical protein n=1 Tax=Oceanobacillus timonensis TaxID=1926285 RepID=UPI0009BAFD29|nr:hypothetical protein [Oceanobacillus timonensis]
MGFLSKIAEVFSSGKNEGEIDKDLIDFLEDELNFEDKNAGIYRVDLKDTERLKNILSNYDFEHKGVDEDGAVIIDDGGGSFKIKESEDKLEILDS